MALGRNTVTLGDRTLVANLQGCWAPLVCGSLLLQAIWNKAEEKKVGGMLREIRDQISACWISESRLLLASSVTTALPGLAVWKRQRNSDRHVSFHRG